MTKPRIHGDYLAYQTLDEQTKQRIAALQLTTYNPFLRKD